MAEHPLARRSGFPDELRIEAPTVQLRGIGNGLVGGVQNRRQKIRRIYQVAVYPALIRPGQRAIKGTCVPAFVVAPLPPTTSPNVVCETTLRSVPLSP